MKARGTAAAGSRRGSALITIVIALVGLAGMSAAVVVTSLYRQSAARALHEQERAFEAAMTGLDIAVYEMREGVDLGGDAVGNAVGNMGGVGYSVTVNPAFAGPGQYTLQSAGSYGPATQAVELVLSSSTGFDFGMFARDGVTMSGSFALDSYDASAGTYASQVVGDHAGEEGDIASNGDIVAGGGMVYGDATPGPGFQVLGDPANVYGSTAPAPAPVVLDPYVYSPALPSAGSYSGAGAITAGTYRYDDFTISGGDVVTIDGAVTLYVDDEFTASGGSQIVLQPGASLEIHHGTNDFTVSGGGIVNQSELPENLSLFSASADKVTLSGGSNFFGLVYAPEAEFESSGGSELFGVIAAASATLSGAGRLHFDVSLNSNGGGTGFEIRSARKISAKGL